MPAPQLIALQNISKDLQVNYASMTGIIRASNSASTLIPYLKIYNPETNELMYTNSSFFSNPNFNYKDIIIDLISADITVGRQGFPSLIEGNLNFRILNQSKMVNPDGTLKNSDLFALLSNINVNFGWANLRNKFNETCIIEDFKINYAGYNIMDLELSFGSPLTYLNKINESALWTNLKDTSKLKTDGLNTNPNNNGKIDLLNDDTINSTFTSLNDPTNPYVSLLSVYDNFIFPTNIGFDSPPVLNGNLLYPIKYNELYKEKYHYFSQYENINNIYNYIPNVLNNNIVSYDGNGIYINIWYANETDFTKTMPLKKRNNLTELTYNAIVPKIFYLYKWDKYINKNINSSTSPDIITKSIIEDIEQNISFNYNDISHISASAINYIYYKTFYFNSNSPIISGNYSQYIVNIINIKYLTKNNGLTFDLTLTYSNNNTIEYKNIKWEDIINSNKYIPDGYSEENSQVNQIKNDIIKSSKTVNIKNYSTNIHQIQTYDKNNNTIERNFLINLVKDHISFIIDLKKLIDKYIDKINNKTKFYSTELKNHIIYDIYYKYSQHNIQNIADLGINASSIIVNDVKANISSNTSLSYIDYAILTELNNINQIPNTIKLYFNNEISNINNDKNWKKYINNDITKYNNKSIIDNFNTIQQCMNLLVNIIQLNDKNAANTINYNNLINFNWRDIYVIITTTDSVDSNNLSEQTKLDQKRAEIQQENIQDNTAQSIITDYQNSNNTTTLQYIADYLNEAFRKKHTDDFLVEIDFFAQDTPSFPNLSTKKSFVIKWDSKLNQYEDTSEKTNNTIELLKNGVHRIENLKIPTHNYNKILEESKSVFDILNGIFKYFNKFNINLMYSVYRQNDTKKTILEIFNIDLISEAVQDWNGDLTFNSISNKLGNGFIVFDYNSLNSIILDLSVNARTQDSLFTVFMPILDKNALAGLFKNLRNDNKKISNKAISNVETIFNSVFKDVNDNNIKNVKTFDGQIRLLQQYAVDDKLSKLLNNKFGNDSNLQNALINLYVSNGSYPAHLLFSAYQITLKILGINNFASFQVFGLRNSGIMDGIYIINTVKHFIDKTKFETTIEATLLNPKIGSYKDLIK